MIGAKFSILPLPVLLVLLSWTAVQASTGEERLIEDILVKRRYNQLARPVEKEEDTVDVKYVVSLIRIEKVDFETDSVTFDVWEIYKWIDYRLAWNQTEYGVSSIRLPWKMIWKPDLLLHAGRFIDTVLPIAVIYSSGEVAWVPTGVASIPCDIDKENVGCTWKIASWTYDGSKLNVTNYADEIDTSGYIERAKFHLLESPCEQNVKRFDCCPDNPMVDVTCKINFTFKK